MSQLRALQEELKALLFFREHPPHASHLWKDGIPKRLGVYRNNVQTNWTDTIDHDFPLTRKQFSDDEWRALEERYFQKFPPQHWELNTSMGTFLKFIESQKVKPYVKELADWEWYDLQIFIDRAVVRPSLGISNPTAIVRVYQHQIFNWVDAGAKPTSPPEQKPEVLVFYRDAKNTCHIREADPLMLLVLEHFKTRGASLETLEPLRRKLLPANNVPLQNVVDRLQKEGLLLL